MYCINCGQQVDDKENFCINCGAKLVKPTEQIIDNKTPNNVTIINNYQTQEEQETPEDKKKADTLCIISAVLMFGSSTFLTALSSMFKSAETFFTGISSMASLAGLVLLIYTRVKYPKNKFAKILMWVYLVLFIFGIITIFVFMIACAIACRDVNTSGCG